MDNFQKNSMEICGKYVYFTQNYLSDNTNMQDVRNIIKQ